MPQSASPTSFASSLTRPCGRGTSLAQFLVLLFIDLLVVLECHASEPLEKTVVGETLYMCSPIFVLIAKVQEVESLNIPIGFFCFGCKASVYIFT